MNSYPGTPYELDLGRILGRHYDLVSWNAIMTSYLGTPL